MDNLFVFIKMKLNTNIKKLKPSATLLINEEVKKLRKKGFEIFHFGFGQSPFPVPKTIVKSLIENAKCNQYLPTKGLPELRKEISCFLNKNQHIKTTFENVFIGPGSKELLYQTILIFEGIFLIPKGSWVSYLPQVNTTGKKSFILDTFFKDNYKLRPEVLETYLKKYESKNNILILNSPNNPSGGIYSSDELKILASVCKKYNVVVLSDEIYSQISFYEKHAPSIYNYYPENTIVFGGLSKVFSAGGYRLGFMVLPNKFENLKIIYQSLFSETFSAVSAPIQYAAIKAYQYKKNVRKSINASVEILKHIGDFVYNKLSNAGIKCTQPQGGFYLLISFDLYRNSLEKLKIFTNTELAFYILNKYKVALLPGIDFYFNKDELIFRLAYVDFNGRKAINEFKRNKGKLNDTFVPKVAPNINSGIRNLIEFVNTLK